MNKYENTLEVVEKIIMNGDAGYDEFTTSTQVIKLVEKYFNEIQQEKDCEDQDNKASMLKERFKELFNDNYMAFMRDEFGDDITEVMWMSFCHGYFCDEDK